MRVAACAASILAVLITAASPACAEKLLTPEDKAIYEKAFKAADKKDWPLAKRLSAKAKEQLPAQVIRWLEMVRPGARVSFKEYARFIGDNPHWPHQRTLRRRAEEAMEYSTGADNVLAWFSKYPPLTTDGRILLGRALFEAGMREAAVDILRATWVDGDFGRKQERDFLARHGSLIRQQEHDARLDRLLWDGRQFQARRMLGKVSKELRRVAEARIVLRQNRRNADSLLRNLSDDQLAQPGLLYERLRWRRRRGKIDSALEILEHPPDDLVRPDLWWREREVIVRRLLERGEHQRAYAIARDHRLERGLPFAEAEWLAGWIALSFLNKPKIALEHFERLYRAVAYPISLARGAYWAGRAETALGNKAAAEAWFDKAAEFDLTYYGQLAAAKISSEPTSAPLQVEWQPDAARIATFNAHELVRVVHMLHELDQEDLMRPFFDRTAEVFKEPEMQILAGRLALEIGRPDYAVRIARRAYRHGSPLTAVGYPTVETPSGGAERALILSIARQESDFRFDAKSPSGARGLLQIMPATARAMARHTNMKYSRRRLMTDPDYNLKLGHAYLTWLLNKYSGSYLLAVAAYNAGPAAVNGWLRDLGDPRAGQISPVDWVEFIPYKETRNYVQRVLENIHVYREHLAETQLAYSLDRDLRR